jgi:serine/threonine protein kinase/tetratricopeptide (TPR) repeat protein
MPGRDIFISYSSKDDAIARLGCERLEQAGYSCWFAPRDIPPGEFYAGQIIQALRESRFVLLFFSEHSNASLQVVREINFAVSQRLPLLVIRLDSTDLNNDFEYLIRISQWLDVSSQPTDEVRAAQILSRIEAAFATLKSEGKSTADKVPIALVCGDFEILADASGKPIELGRGGMGVTYRARQISMGGREVALKVIQPDLLSDDNVRHRFLREAKLAGEIDHENVALVYSRGQEGDSFYYAMQLVEGIDLDRHVKANGPLSVRDALSVTAQVASALEAAHSKGLIHRDIKPSNIMAVRRRNALRVKLIDFGLAKDVRQSDIHSSILSGREEFKGTLAFASPEQCQALPLDTRSDLYSLGVTLWFLLSGKVPFSGNLAAVGGAHIWAPLPLQQLPSLPESVLKLLRSLLAKAPGDRPQTPTDLVDRIEELQPLLRTADLGSPATTANISAEPTGDVSQPSRQAESDTTLVGEPVLADYLRPVPGQLWADRFELKTEAREGISGRLFLAIEKRGTTTRTVGLKLLHPSISAQPENLELIQRHVAAIQKIPSEHLLAYYSLESLARPAFIVREWFTGISFAELLRLRGTLKPKELVSILNPLPTILDNLANFSLELVEVSLGKLAVCFPSSVQESQYKPIVKRQLSPDLKVHLKFNPLSFRPLVARSYVPALEVTMLSNSRLLALSQASTGIPPRSHVQLFAELIVELLSGRPKGSDPFRPLPALSEAGNQVLRSAWDASVESSKSCAAFWEALLREISKEFVQPVPQASSEPRAEPRRSALTRAVQEHCATLEQPGSEESALTKAVQEYRATLEEPWSQESESRQLSAKTRAMVEVQKLREKLYETPPGPTEVATPSAAPPEKLRALPWLYRMANPTAPSPFEKWLWAKSTPTTPERAIKGGLPVSKEPASDSGPGSPSRRPPPWLIVAVLVVLAAVGAWVAIGPKIRSEEAFDRAIQEYKNRDLKASIADFTEAIRLKPDYADAFVGRGCAYSELKQYDRTISDYTEAIRLKPDDALAFHNRGLTYANLNQYDKAVSDFSEAIRLKPDYADAFYSRGCAYDDLKQSDKAISDFSEAILFKPDYADAFVGRGNAYVDLKQYDKAFSDYSEAILFKPDYAGAFYNRGNAYVDLKQYDEAVSDYSEAIRLNPDSALALNNRGYAYSNLNQYDNAIADLSEAIRLKPDSALALNNRALCYEKVGNNEAAQRDRAKARELTK